MLELHNSGEQGERVSPSAGDRSVGRKKVSTSSDLVLKSLISAQKSQVDLAVEYKDKNGRRTARRITVNEVFELFGVKYVDAYCHLRKAKRKFRVDGLCLSGSKKVSGTNKKKIGTKKTVRAGEKKRAKCSTKNCENLVTLKDKRNGIPRYRTLCSSCNKKKVQRKLPTEEARNRKTAGNKGKGGPQYSDVEGNLGLENIMESSFPVDSDINQEFVSTAIEELRLKLLDFSRRNKLINFSHNLRGTAFIRAVDEVPDVLFGKLIDGAMEFKCLPDLEDDPKDEQTHEFELALANAKLTDESYLEDVGELDDSIDARERFTSIERSLKDRVRVTLKLPEIQRGQSPDLRSHARIHGFDPSYSLPLNVVRDKQSEQMDNYIQTLFMKADLKKRHQRIYSTYQSNLRETGFNTLQMAFGFLEWIPADQSEVVNISPLILMPLEMERTKSGGGYSYTVTSETGHAVVNETLVEVMSRRHGVKFPEFDPDQPIKSYFRAINSKISSNKGWRIHPYVTLGFFPFSDIAIYNDLDVSKWGQKHILLGHDTVARLLGGKAPEEYTGLVETIHDIDELTTQGNAPAIVLDADSSQHSALVEATKGRSMVIQGPPGTGKSQTIANLICSAVAQGKSVLFLAEKQPALDVVSSRLKNIGLGCLLMEPHTGVGSVKLVDSLRDRLEEKSSFRESQYKYKFDRLTKQIKFSGRVKALLSAPTDYCALDLYQLIWRYLSLENRCFNYDISRFGVSSISSLTVSERDRHFSQIARYFEHVQPYIGQPSIVAQIGDLKPNIIAVRDLISRSTLAAEVIQDLLSCVDEVLSRAGDITLGKIPDLIALIQNINLIPNLEVCLRKSHLRQEIESHQEDLRILELIKLKIAEFGDSREFDLDVINNLLADAKELDLRTVTKSNLEAQKEQYSKTADMVRKVDKFLDEFPFPVERSVAVFKQLAKCLQKTDSGSLKYLLSMQIDEVDQKKISVLEQFSDQLQKSKKLISSFSESHDGIDVDDLSGISHRYGSGVLESVLDVLSSAGPFSWFSGSFRAAKRTVRELGFDEPNTPILHGKLKKLIHAILAIEEISEEPSYEKHSGRAFDGCKTDGELLLHIINLLKSARHANENLQNFFGSQLSLVEMERVSEELQALLLELNTLVGPVKINVQEELKEVLTHLENFHGKLVKIKQDFELTGLNQECSVPLGAVFSGSQNDLLSKQLKSADIVTLCRLSEEIDSRVTADPHKLGQDQAVINQLLSGVSALEENYKKIQSEFPVLRVEKSIIPAICQLDIDRCRELCHRVTYLLGDLCEAYDIAEAFWNGCGGHINGSISELLGKMLEVQHWETEKVLADIEKIKVEREIKLSDHEDFFAKLGQEKVDCEDLARDLFELKIATKILGDFANQNAGELTDVVGSAVMKHQTDFKELDRGLLALEAARTKHSGLQRKIPSGVGYGPKRDWTERYLIENEIGKKSRHIRSRELIHRAFGAIFAMKPVWLMQPKAISQYLPKCREIFDLLVIDEASQMLPEKAIASVVRSKQTIVVGDDMQMPPSQVFSAGLGEFEEEEEIDSESILDLASQRTGNTVRLRWHYRSRHPSLIRFSDNRFYDDSLQLFPAPLDSDDSLGVRHIKVDGVFKGQINNIEAEKVLLEAKECMARYPDQSIGIVAINRAQMEHIQEELDRLKDFDPIVRSYYEHWQNELEAPVVKNLERAQGDERDIIIISTVYGPTEAGGPVPNRFPLINTKTGHRRLNVLFTRAKNKVILVTSLNPSDIRLDPTSHRGKRAFRDYIEYVATGRLEQGEETVLEADSDFEIFVAEALKDAGFTATPQVGVRGFRIDIGVGHPDFKNGFIAGIECDGATYHSSASARDRDRIRQDILEGLGWRIYRIWSTDWFNNQEKEKEKMLAWLSQVWQKYSKLDDGSLDQERGFDLKVETETGLFEDDRADPQIEKSESEEVVQMVGPSGIQRELEIDEVRVTYYEPVTGLYEIWDDNKVLVGDVERDAKSRSLAPASGFDGIAKPQYRASLLFPQKITRDHTDIFEALRWLYREYKRHALH